MSGVDHIRGQTFHGRKGKVQNAFRYAVDYVLLDAESEISGPSLFSRNARNLVSLHDRDHGGPPGDGRGADWLRAILAQNGLVSPTKVLLLTQPRVLGHVFNPVSFWLCENADGAVYAVVAEVTNTFGERHSYLCQKPDGSPISPTDRIPAQKVFFVSPFQPVEGEYVFRFDIRGDRIGIWIDYRQGGGGVLATLTGDRRPLTNKAILRAAFARPFGSRRVLGLIHWQALRLWLKRAGYRARPEPPAAEVSRG